MSYHSGSDVAVVYGGRRKDNGIESRVFSVNFEPPVNTFVLELEPFSFEIPSARYWHAGFGACNPFFHAFIAAVVGDKLYMHGGRQNSATQHADGYSLDLPLGAHWQNLPNLPTPRERHTAGNDLCQTSFDIISKK